MGSLFSSPGDLPDNAKAEKWRSSYGMLRRLHSTAPEVEAPDLLQALQHVPVRGRGIIVEHPASSKVTNTAAVTSTAEATATATSTTTTTRTTTTTTTTTTAATSAAEAGGAGGGAGATASTPATATATTTTTAKPLSNDELTAAWGKEVMLVDVRAPGEQAVSRIPGAITKEEFEQLLGRLRAGEEEKGEYKDTSVVCYCTIGTRSGMFVKKAMEEAAPFHRIVNLKGSLLAWTHLNGAHPKPWHLFNIRPLEDPKWGKATKRVHVYAKSWNMAHSSYHAVY